MVSSQLPTYEAEIVRLIQGGPNPMGSGLEYEPVATSVSGRYEGRTQELRRGSFVVVPEAAALDTSEGFTLQAWILPTTPHKEVQGIRPNGPNPPRSASHPWGRDPAVPTDVSQAASTPERPSSSRALAQTSSSGTFLHWSRNRERPGSRSTASIWPSAHRLILCCWPHPSVIRMDFSALWKISSV